MKRILTALLALVMVAPLGLFPAKADAQYVPDVLAKGQDVLLTNAASVAAGHFPILIKYVGTSPAGGTVTVAANGDITLKTGPVGSSVADATTECPVSGAYGGVIDVSDAACNTYGEVVDAINASANWRAVIQDGLRSFSSDDALAALAETSAAVPAGLALGGDSATSFKSVLAVVPVRNDIRYYLSPDRNQNLNPDPFQADGVLGRTAQFWYVTGTSTYGSGTSSIVVRSVRVRNARATISTSIAGGGLEDDAETFTLAGGATTVAQSYDWTRYGLGGKRGRKYLIGIENSAAMSATSLNAFARFYEK